MNEQYEPIPFVNFLQIDSFARMDEDGVIYLTFPVIPHAWYHDPNNTILAIRPGDEHHDTLRTWIQAYYDAVGN